MSRPEAALKVRNDPIPHVFLGDPAPPFSPHLAGSFGVGKDDLETLRRVREACPRLTVEALVPAHLPRLQSM